MKVLVCGDRKWSNHDRLYKVLDELHQQNPITLIIEGEASGADTLARLWAKSKNIPVEGHPAHWDKYGRAAGPMRNAEMLKSNPDLVLAFHNKITFSKGTLNMLKRAQQANVKSILFTETKSIPVEELINSKD